MSNFQGALLKRSQGRIALALLLGIVLLGIFTGTAYSQEENANQEQNPEPILPANGYDLLNLMTFRAGMKLVTSFEELENSSTGMLILLGNQNSRVNWPSIDRWVRRGGVLLVAFDDTPPRTLQVSIGEITGYQWANIRLLHFGESGVDQLPQHSFADIQKIVPFDWHLWPKPGNTPPNEKPANGKGHSNSPSFLFPLESNFPKAAVFATFTTDVRLDIANGLSMRPPAFQMVFGTQATRGRGRIIQLADPDLFSNQMLELPWNFFFAWSLLNRIIKDVPGPTAPFAPFPVMIVGQKIESEVFYLPIPPLPLPDLDPFQLASMAVRVVGEKLPEWESPGGPFDRLSNRLSRFMTFGFWVTIGGVALAMLALWIYAKMRGGFRGIHIASKTANENRTTPLLSPSKSQTTSKAVLDTWMENENTKEIPLWELGKIADQNRGEAKASAQTRAENRIQVKTAKRLMNWIALDTGAWPKVQRWAFLQRFLNWSVAVFGSKNAKVESALGIIGGALPSRESTIVHPSPTAGRFQEREKE